MIFHFLIFSDYHILGLDDYTTQLLHMFRLILSYDLLCNDPTTDCLLYDFQANRVMHFFIIYNEHIYIYIYITRLFLLLPEYENQTVSKL